MGITEKTGLCLLVLCDVRVPELYLKTAVTVIGNFVIVFTNHSFPTESCPIPPLYSLLKHASI